MPCPAIKFIQMVRDLQESGLGSQWIEWRTDALNFRIHIFLCVLSAYRGLSLSLCVKAKACCGRTVSVKG